MGKSQEYRYMYMLETLKSTGACNMAWKFYRSQEHTQAGKFKDYTDMYGLQIPKSMAFVPY
jgi:hypothetical protein